MLACLLSSPGHVSVFWMVSILPWISSSFGVVLFAPSATGISVTFRFHCFSCYQTRFRYLFIYFFAETAKSSNWYALFCNKVYSSGLADNYHFFFTPCKFFASVGGLSPEPKFFQLSRTLLGIPADVNTSVVCVILNSFFDFQFCQSLFQAFGDGS